MKLLPERLREWADERNDDIRALDDWTHYFGGTMENPPSDGDIWNTIADEIERTYIPRAEHIAALREATDMANGSSPHWAFHAWADAHGMPFQKGESVTKWLERYYIPRPRFEDGEPVPWGTDDIAWGRGKRYAFNALSKHGVPIAKCASEIYAYAEMTYDGFVKRLTSKVYDADGVDIKVGDTLYYCDTKRIEQKAGTVAFIGSSYSREEIKFEGETVYHDSKYFTHECPVFDAEGVRICKGDTVWHKETGEKHFVEELTGDGGFYIDRSSITWGGDMFTHSEPDSLGRIHADIHDYVAINMLDDTSEGEYLKQIAERVALIERGAK